jgi:hypothetical protein
LADPDYFGKKAFEFLIAVDLYMYSHFFWGKNSIIYETAKIQKDNSPCYNISGICHAFT